MRLTKLFSSRATAAVQTVPAMPRPMFRPIVENVMPSQGNMTSAFDPAKHLAFTPPSQIIKMKDLGFSETVGVSPVAVSEPFQMFSSEAIQQMRAEILKPEVMEQCNYRSNIAACQLRGYSSR